MRAVLVMAESSLEPSGWAMASGDAQRVWFPELLKALTAAWSPAMSWEELADLLERLNEQRKAIRNARGIVSPMQVCRGCGAASRADVPGISIRSALFALKNAGALGESELEQCDARWKRHQRARGLDAYGRARRRTSTCNVHTVSDEP